MGSLSMKVFLHYPIPENEIVELVTFTRRKGLEIEIGNDLCFPINSKDTRAMIAANIKYMALAYKDYDISDCYQSKDITVLSHHYTPENRTIAIIRCLADKDTVESIPCPYTITNIGMELCNAPDQKRLGTYNLVLNVKGTYELASITLGMDGRFFSKGYTILNTNN